MTGARSTMRAMAVVGALTCVAAGCGGQAPSGPSAAPSTPSADAPPEWTRTFCLSGGCQFDPASIASFDGFPLLWLGARFEGLPLTSIQRRYDDRAPSFDPGRPPLNQVVFVYGSCTPEPGQDRCDLPLQVQVFPACSHAIGHVRRAGTLPDLDATMRRGVPVVSTDDGAVWVHTDRILVKLYGRDDALLRRAVDALVPANTPARAMLGRSGRRPLPRATRGAAEGRLRCTSDLKGPGAAYSRWHSANGPTAAARADRP